MDKVLFKNQFLAVLERDGYVFSREVRSNGKLVAVVPFRHAANGREYLARVEICPAHSPKPERCSITGGIENDEAPRLAAQRELVEEAGYAVEAQSLIDLGQVRPSKSAATIVYLFAVDITGLTPQAAHGDGTRWEDEAWVEWVSHEQGLQIEDPLFVTALGRLEGNKHVL